VLTEHKVTVTTRADRQFSNAPLGWPLVEVARDNLPDVIPQDVVLQTPNGERFWRTRPPDPATVIESKMALGTKRANYEKDYYSRSEMGRNDYLGSTFERAHAQGAGTGYESKYGISYASSEINQELQNLGIEEFLRLIETYRPKEVTYQLLTEVRRHPGSLRLRQIVYTLHGIYQGQRRLILVTGIRVPNITGAKPEICKDLTEMNWEAISLLPINDLPMSILLRRAEMIVRTAEKKARRQAALGKK
jgi:hypothetical protein